MTGTPSDHLLRSGYQQTVLWQRCGCRTVRHRIGSSPGVSGLSGWGHIVWSRIWIFPAVHLRCYVLGCATERLAWRSPTGWLSFTSSTFLVKVTAFFWPVLRLIWYIWILAFQPHLDYVVTGLGLGLGLEFGLHPLHVGWWFGGLEHEHLLVGPGEELWNIQISQNLRLRELSLFWYGV